MESDAQITPEMLSNKQNQASELMLYGWLFFGLSFFLPLLLWYLINGFGLLALNHTTGHPDDFYVTYWQRIFSLPILVGLFYFASSTCFFLALRKRFSITALVSLILIVFIYIIFMMFFGPDFS